MWSDTSARDTLEPQHRVPYQKDLPGMIASLLSSLYFRQPLDKTSQISADPKRPGKQDSPCQNPNEVLFNFLEPRYSSVLLFYLVQEQWRSRDRRPFSIAKIHRGKMSLCTIQKTLEPARFVLPIRNRCK